MNKKSEKQVNTQVGIIILVLVYLHELENIKLRYEEREREEINLLNE